MSATATATPLGKLRRPQSLTACVLTCYNILLLFFGLVLLIGSSFTSSQFTDRSWSSILITQIATSGIVTGLLTLCLAFFGIYASVVRKRVLLIIYLVLLVVIIVLQMSAAAGMMMYSQQFNIRDDSSPSGDLTSTLDITINNVVFSTYTTCCTGCPSGACNNTLMDPSIQNVTLPWCSFPNSTCTQIRACDGSSAKCFKFQRNVPVIVPPSNVDPYVCTLMRSMKGVKNNNIVDFAFKGGCGQGNPTQFLYDLDASISRGAYNVSVLFFVVAIIEILVLVAGVALVTCASREQVSMVTGFDVENAEDEWR